MKKQFVLTICFFAFVATGFSQVAIRGGLNYSQVSVDGDGVDFGSDPKVGYHLGLQANVGLPGLFSVRPALLYHLKGGDSETGAGNTDLSYFEVPVNLGLAIGPESLRIILEAGPYFGYLVNASSDLFTDPEDNLNKTDWGVNFGAVVELSNLGLGVNYSNSLSNIANEDRLNTAFKLTNGNLALFAYLKF